MREYLLSILALCLLCGCVHLQRHPETWNPPTQVTSQIGCPPISGVYENLGRDPKGKPVNLAQLLSYTIKHDPNTEKEINRNWDGLKTVSQIELSTSTDGVFTVTARGTGFVKAWSFEGAKGQYKCEKGILTLHQNGDGSGVNVAAYESSTMDLYLVDKDLVVHRHGGSAGVVLLIPAAYYESTWARFALKP